MQSAATTAQNVGVDGIHDMGGMEGFGPVPYVPGERPFHEEWERRALVVAALAQRAVGANVDEFRHAIERIPPADYLTASYFGRWIRAAETLVAEGERPKPAPGTRRPVDRPPRFAVGDRVCTRPYGSPGHTRLPAYCRGRVGTIARVHPSFVLPDTNAHRRGEKPEYVYAVRFSGRELWGDEADPALAVHVDLFESYLEPEPA